LHRMRAIRRPPLEVLLHSEAAVAGDQQVVMRP
jgi:hypothetical protein